MRREPPGHRNTNSAARFAAPVVFLTAVTIAVLLVRSGLSEGDNAAAPPATPATTTAPTTTEAVVLPGTTQAGTTGTGEREVVYEIEEGDTLETIAVEFDTTVERLLTLNPGLDPVALRIGEEIRVK